MRFPAHKKPVPRFKSFVSELCRVDCYTDEEYEKLMGWENTPFPRTLPRVVGEVISKMYKKMPLEKFIREINAKKPVEVTS